MPVVTLFTRATPSPVGAAQSDGGVSGMYIVGFSITGAVFIGLTIWLGVYFYRRTLAKKRQDQTGASFLSVRGLVKEDGISFEKVAPSQKNLPSHTFSRNNINSQIVLPSKALTKLSSEQEQAERDRIIAHHRQSSTIPKPFSFALQPPGLAASAERSSIALSSRMSRFSVVSTASSFNGSLASSTTGGAGRSIRKVRQVFNPVLPDELLITSGEQLMVLQSFDDGWCVVGRESGVLMPQPKSLFGGIRSSRALTPTVFGHGGVGTSSGGNVELGMVPAWCFLKPVKGLRAERPMRSSSLGVTVQMNQPNAERDDLISWSNF